MIILGIETSCDETALSLIEIEAKDGAPAPATVKVLANNVLSQIAIHKEYGGVFPALAKREHSRNLIPLLKKTLEESGLSELKVTSEKLQVEERVKNILEREPELLKQFLEFIPTTERPLIDVISVTHGPGLEPALWVGINFAKALSVTWNIPVIAANHMEGHVLVALLQAVPSEKFKVESEEKTPKAESYILETVDFPALALLISGGHTELVLMKGWREYEVIGKTRDDAVGEAFDKVARILGLPYPGGPEISKLAEITRTNTEHTSTDAEKITLPRPMLHSNNLDFSFSGLKTAVLYTVQKLTQTESSTRDGLRSVSVSPRLQSLIAREFEDAATEVIISKVKKAIEMYGAKTLILGGGVVANKNIRKACQNLAAEENILLKLPEINHSTDNALMIALAGHFNKEKTLTETTGLLDIRADGNLHFKTKESYN